jgi:hypothetical protein
MEAMWNQGLAPLATAFSHRVAQMTNLFWDYVGNSREFGLVKVFHSNCQRYVSVTGRKIGIPPFVDFVKGIEAFPTTECACEKLFCQLPNFVGDFWHVTSASMIVDLLVIETRITWTDAAHIKECAEALSKVQLDT